MKIAYTDEWNNQKIGAGFDGYAPPINFFEAGKRPDSTTPYPFAGSVGSPVASDPNFTKAENGTWSFAGESASVGVHSALAYQFPVYKGVAKKCISDTELLTSTGSTGSLLFDEPLSDGTTSNRIALVFAGGAVKIQTVIGGSVTNNATIATLPITKPSRMVSEWTIDGADVSLSATIYDGATEYIVSGSVTNGYNTAVNYGATLFSYFDSQKWRYIRIEGTGYPYNE